MDEPRSSTLPDLTILVRSRRSGGRTALTFTLVHRTPPPGGNFEEFGPQPLEQEPPAFFRQLFEDIERSATATVPPDDLARRLAAKGARLFLEILPPALQQRLGEIRTGIRTVQVFSDELWIPWELLKFKGEPGNPAARGPFFGEVFAITRWLRGTPEALTLPLRHLAVVAPRDSDLRHAGEEVERLKLHEAADRRVEEIPGRFAAVVDALAAGRHDGWHFTGHGIARGDDPHRYVLLLEGNETLRPEDLADEADLHEAGPLVFLNGCQTGRGGRSLTGLGGWAPAFFQAGARAFVGTHWTVGDREACLFAETFYGELFAGTAVGEAALRARLAVRERFPGDPSWLAYTVLAHPRATCRVPLGPAGLERRWRAAPPRIRERILDFSRLVSEKTRGFVGRGWVFDELDRFLAEKPRGYFLLEGDPGIGKSSVMAELVRRRGLVHHFNQRGEAARTADAFLASLSAQLIATYGLPHEALPPDATVDGRFLSALLEQAAAGLPAGERIVVALDSLDEAEAQTPLVGNVHFLPSQLPPGVYFVVSSRRHGPRLHLGVEHRTLTIDQDGAANLADIRELLRSRMSPGLLAYLAAQRLDQDTFVEEMAARSQGNFMYLHHVLPEIESGAYQERSFDRLPAGLALYYEDHWQRMRALGEADWFEWKLPVLEALTVVQEPVSARLVARFAGVEDPRRVQRVLRDWREFLYETEVADPETGERQKRYRLYHASFQEFIADKDEVREERVRLKDRHGRIADLLWEDLFGDQDAG